MFDLIVTQISANQKAIKYFSETAGHVNLQVMKLSQVQESVPVECGQLVATQIPEIEGRPFFLKSFYTQFISIPDLQLEEIFWNQLRRWYVEEISSPARYRSSFRSASARTFSAHFPVVWSSADLPYFW